jgi:hypothetical protein
MVKPLVCLLAVMVLVVAGVLQNRGLLILRLEPVGFWGASVLLSRSSEVLMLVVVVLLVVLLAAVLVV